MYLSRLTLNPHARRVQRELANPYELHRTLMRSFPDDLKKGDERVLFRVEIDNDTGIPTVLLQSTLEPAWGWLQDNGARDYLLRAPESKPFELAFTAEQTLAFRLRANPTVKHSEHGQRQGRRDPLYKEDEQRAWLVNKGKQGGFHILRLSVAAEGDHVAWQSVENGPRRKLTMLAVRFDGILQVTDPVQLWETVQKGIGPGKGLGFGLLSLARA